MAMRTFHFTGGGSDKFWSVEVAGTVMTVVFGRRGTAGQRQDKTFADSAKARAAADKLITEKVGKGYVESGGEVAAVAPKAGAAAKASQAKAAAAKPVAMPAKRSAAKGPAPVDAAAPAAPAAAAPAVLEAASATAPRIALDAQDLLALPRPGPAVPVEKPRPFDQAQCCAHLAGLAVDPGRAWQHWRLAELDLPPVMTPQEAVFWTLALEQYCARAPATSPLPAAVAEKLAKVRIPSALPAAQVATIIGKLGVFTVPNVVLLLHHLLTPEEFVRLATGPTGRGTLGEALSRVIPGVVGTQIVPRLAPATLAAYRSALRTRLDGQTWRGSGADGGLNAFELAGCFGLQAELDALMATVTPDDAEDDPSIILVLLGLEPAAAVRHAVRLKMRPGDVSVWGFIPGPQDIAGNVRQARMWLAATGVAGVDLLAEAVIAKRDKAPAQALAEVVALVEAPEAAKAMLAIRARSRAPAVAQQWFARHPRFALSGLAPLLGAGGAPADAARSVVRQLYGQGGQALVEEVAATLTPAQASALRAAVGADQPALPAFAAGQPAWFPAPVAAKAAKPAKLPAWAEPAALPPLVADGRRLRDEQVRAVVAALAAPDTDEVLFAAVKRHVAAQSADAFVWQLFQAWLQERAPGAHKWAMLAMGRLGGDGCVHRLVPLIRTWPGESQHARAVTGLEVLRAIGSDVALMQLNGIAQKLPFKGLKAKAGECMEEIARAKGLTRAELEDRVVPDCGLDARGERSFDFGARRFTFQLGPELKPVLRDAAGKLLPGLPKPGAKDDAALAATAAEEWKILRKQVADVAALQAGRLEQAMVTARRWNAAEFRTLLVDHPLLIHLVRRLVWAGFDAAGARRALFRVSDERETIDHAERPVDLAALARVGVVHPLHLSATEAGAWGQQLSDYGIVQPFPQLGRAVHRAQPEELKVKAFTRFRGLKLPAPTLVFGLEKAGWRRGAALDGGGFCEHSRYFPAAGCSVVVTYSGEVAMDWIEPDAVLAVEDCHLVAGEHVSSWKAPAKPMALTGADPVVVSEVLGDLLQLAGKAVP